MKRETFEYSLVMALILVVGLLILSLTGCSSRRDRCRTWSPDIQQYITHRGGGCP